MDQFSMFTSEEQSGSGQLNMVSLIDQNEARIKELRNTPHVFHTDPGHGWLEVKKSDIIILDIMGSISPYSYKRGDAVYLEEDSDAGKYIKALWGDEIGSPEFDTWKTMLQDKYQENSFVRHLPYYK